MIQRHRDVLRMPSGKGNTDSLPDLAFYGRLVTSLPLMAAFFYFALVAGAGVGMQNFSVTALVEIYDAPLYLAAAGLTAYLGGSALGVLAGGELADRLPRHALIATGGLAIAAASMAVIAALPLPMPAIVVMLALAGFCYGCTGPSRDILVRGATPPGATGKVFGFVYSGLDLGSSLAPLLFGALMDGGQYRAVFVAVAAMYGIGILTVVQLSRGRRPTPAAAD
jgi:MFS family permease